MKKIFHTNMYRELLRHPLLLLLLCLIAASCDFSEKEIPEEEPQIIEIAEVIPEPEMNVWGFLDNYSSTETQRVRRNQNLSVILRSKGLTHRNIYEISQASRGVFDLRRIVVGNKLIFFYDEEEDLQHFVYEINTRQFVHFDLSGDSPVVTSGQKESETRIQYVEGEISGSLYQTLLNKNIDPSLAYRLSDVFAWQIDFYRIRRGDRFSVLYEEEFVDGSSIGVRSILATEFIHRGTAYNAFLYEQNDMRDYYDREGNALRGQFLRAPLEYSRISSGFTNRRFHPVLGRNMPHHGTDYAAPTGTPIRAVADGIVTVSSTDRNNGNWIKIRHNGVYETGYLHMSRFANGVRRGSEVKQGQIIGYVGQTGLATGPHLCYRFWVNGQPADPRRVDLPPSEPIDDKYRDNFDEHIFRLASIMQRKRMDYEYEYLIAALNEKESDPEELPLTL